MIPFGLGQLAPFSSRSTVDLASDAGAGKPLVLKNTVSVVFRDRLLGIFWGKAKAKYTKKKWCNRESNMWSYKAPQRGPSHIGECWTIFHSSTTTPHCVGSVRLRGVLEGVPAIGTYIPYLILCLLIRPKRVWPHN
jgi:hypothetical protein